MKTFLTETQKELVRAAVDAMGPLGCEAASVDIIAVEQDREMRAWGSCHDSYSLFLFGSCWKSRWIN